MQTTRNPSSHTSSHWDSVALEYLESSPAWDNVMDNGPRFNRIIMGSRRNTHPYIHASRRNKLSITQEKNTRWFVSNPESIGCVWDNEWNMAFWGAGITLRKEFHLVDALEDIVWRANENLDNPTNLAKYGPGGTLPELLWLIDNNYEFEQRRDGRWVAYSTSSTPETCVIYDYYNPQLISMQMAIQKLTEFYEKITDTTWNQEKATASMLKKYPDLIDRPQTVQNVYAHPLIEEKKSPGKKIKPALDDKRLTNGKPKPSTASFAIIIEKPKQKTLSPPLVEEKKSPSQETKPEVEDEPLILAPNGKLKPYPDSVEITIIEEPKQSTPPVEITIEEPKQNTPPPAQRKTFSSIVKAGLSLLSKTPTPPIVPPKNKTPVKIKIAPPIRNVKSDVNVTTKTKKKIQSTQSTVNLLFLNNKSINLANTSFGKQIADSYLLKDDKDDSEKTPKKQKNSKTIFDSLEKKPISKEEEQAAFEKNVIKIIRDFRRDVAVTNEKEIADEIIKCLKNSKIKDNTKLLKDRIQSVLNIETRQSGFLCCRKKNVVLTLVNKEKLLGVNKIFSI